MANIKIYRIILISKILILNFFIKSDSFSEKAKDAFDKVYNLISKQIPGLLMSFGFPPKDYVYNFKIYNDSNDTVYCGTQKVIGLMGANFPISEGVDNKKTLIPIFASNINYKSKWMNIPYYFTIYLSKNFDPKNDSFFSKNIWTLGEKNSKVVNYYRIFNSSTLFNNKYNYFPEIEFIGSYEPSKKNNSKVNNPPIRSNKLDKLIFLNNTEFEIDLIFKNGTAVKLDSYSSNVLESNGKNSLRPNIFKLINKDNNFEKEIILGEKGFAGYIYTIEIYKTEDKKITVGWQGLTPNKSELGISDRVRNITPINIYFWAQSLDQIGVIEGSTDNQGDELFVLPGDLFIFYNNEKNTKFLKIKNGENKFIEIFRPQIEKNYSFFYSLYFEIVNLEKFNDFLKKNNFKKEILFENFTKTILNSNFEKKLFNQINEITVENIEKILESKLDFNLNDYNYIFENIEAGFSFKILGIDIFFPTGVSNKNLSIGGMLPNFYYVLSPSKFNIYKFAYFISNFIDFNKMMNNLNLTESELNNKYYAIIFSKINDWIKIYYSLNSLKLEENIKNFILPILKNEYTFEKVLNEIRFGAISLKNLTIKYSTIQNYYSLYPGIIPQGLPSEKIIKNG